MYLVTVHHRGVTWCTETDGYPDERQDDQYGHYQTERARFREFTCG